MKLKSHSGMKKRVKATSRKKLVMRKAAVQHLLSNKSKRQKRSYRRTGVPVFEGFDADVRKQLPYL